LESALAAGYYAFLIFKGPREKSGTEESRYPSACRNERCFKPDVILNIAARGPFFQTRGPH
jgi:hypothetical protein